MSSSGPSSSSPNLAQLSSPASTNTPDRRSADIVMLAKPSPSSTLTRVKSTPVSQLDEARFPSPPGAKPSSPGDDHTAMLTLAPPKPSPADTLYPSPSGGFVPSPEEGQDWRLKPPPARKDWSETPRDRFERSNRLSPGASRPDSLDLHEVGSRPLSSDGRNSLSQSLGSTSRLSPTAPTRPPSIPPSQETASLIADASSASLSRRSSQASQHTGSPRIRPLSSASSISRRGLSGASGSSNARKRRSTASAHSRRSDRPRSSASAVTAQQSEVAGGESSTWAPIVVRDFAFDPSDPRYAGQREAGLADDEGREGGLRPFEDGEAGEEEWGDLGSYEDEDEFVGDEGDQASLPEGVYRVLYDFTSESEHELSVQAEEMVRVVGTLEGGWAIVTKEADSEIKGIVPATYLEWSSE